MSGRRFEEIGDAAVLAWSIAKWPVLLVVVWLMFSLLYWACPNVKQAGRRWITPGAAIAIGLWLVCSGLFALYVSFSGSYNKTYGSLGAVIILMVWFYVMALFFVAGAELNAELLKRNAPKEPARMAEQLPAKVKGVPAA